ncbi:hypothetical protein B0H19DRAFT_1143153 [Mycena capillaripes]|nr:hypothetical protein B0H19DRAFT_1143153 [Mycena capillaripes]
MSRVTGPKISENIRTCHGSPKGFSNVPKSHKIRENGPKNSNFRVQHFFSISGPSGILRLLGMSIIAPAVDGTDHKSVRLGEKPAAFWWIFEFFLGVTPLSNHFRKLRIETCGHRSHPHSN